MATTATIITGVTNTSTKLRRVGELFPSNEGYDFTIIEYTGACDVTI